MNAAGSFVYYISEWTACVLILYSLSRMIYEHICSFPVPFSILSSQHYIVSALTLSLPIKSKNYIIFSEAVWEQLIFAYHL
jgi:hypothetical protein